MGWPQGWCQTQEARARATRRAARASAVALPPERRALRQPPVGARVARRHCQALALRRAPRRAQRQRAGGHAREAPRPHTVWRKSRPALRHPQGLLAVRAARRRRTARSHSARGWRRRLRSARVARTTCASSTARPSLAAATWGETAAFHAKSVVARAPARPPCVGLSPACTAWAAGSWCAPAKRATVSPSESGTPVCTGLTKREGERRQAARRPEESKVFPTPVPLPHTATSRMAGGRKEGGGGRGREEGKEQERREER
eukprot:scaffold253407_cov28-Tisochrysis_lutea.AAC.1